LISTALKLAQRMKLHRRDQRSTFSTTELEQRKHVFWIAYVMDKDISLRTGELPAQDDDDMDVEPPAETTDTSTGGINSVNFFNLHIGIAIIQGQIYKCLCSTKTQKTCEIECSFAAKQLLEMLETWHRSVPNVISGPHSDLSSRRNLLHSVILNFTYLNANNTLQRFLCTTSQSGLESTALISPPDVSILCSEICVSEARTSLRLLSSIPQGDYACVWFLLQDIFLASTTILTYVTSNPAQNSVDMDLDFIDPVIILLQKLQQKEANSDVEMMENTLTEMQQWAVQPLSTRKRTRNQVLGLRLRRGMGVIIRRRR